MPNTRYPNHRKTIVLFLLLLCLFFSLNAQRYTISGYVRDAQTGESLIASSVFDKISSSGSTTNTFGFYSITLKSDSVNLFYSYVGFEHQNIRFLLKKGYVDKSQSQCSNAR